jgi:hypothetical protein
VVFHRWSRFKSAVGVSLPTLIDIELRSIPTHTWELETAEHLLDQWCWVSELHPDTANPRDYSSFRVRAWCVNPDLVPPSMELVVVEPPMRVEEAQPLKRALGHPINISATPPAPPSTAAQAAQPPSPPAQEGPDVGPSRRRRRFSASSESGELSDGSSARGATPRRACKTGSGAPHRPRGRAEFGVWGGNTQSSSSPLKLLRRRFCQRESQHLCPPRGDRDPSVAEVIMPTFGNERKSLELPFCTIPEIMGTASQAWDLMLPAPSPAAEPTSVKSLHKASSPQVELQEKTETDNSRATLSTADGQDVEVVDIAEPALAPPPSPQASVEVRVAPPSTAQTPGAPGALLVFPTSTLYMPS